MGFDLSMATILLADDHLLVRDTIASYLAEKGGYTVRSAASVEEAFVVLSAFSPVELAIFDYQMPGMDGLEGLVRLKSRYPRQRTAMMSGVASPEVADEAIKLGAVAFFPKSMPVKLMLDGIRQLLTDEPTILSGNEEAARAHKETDRVELTARERQILKMIASGSSNKLIARELGLKEVTVKFHVTNILAKLDVSNRTQAAILARTVLSI